MSKILFVEEKLRADKLGILYISRILKDGGHQVDLIQDQVDDFDAYLKSHEVDFILYSVTSGSNKWFLNKNKELKRKYKFVSIMGGPHFTFFPEDAENDPDIDFCVRGPGEGAILDVIEGRAKEKIVRGHIACDINDIPEPDRSIIYKYDEFGKASMKRFIASRDCPNSCKYCYNHLFHKFYSDEKDRLYQITNVDKMIQEVLNVKEQYGLELAFFNDDDLSVNHEWLEEFCEKFKEKVGVSFGISVRANNVNRYILKKLADHGCSIIHLSVESANPETQKFLRRGFIKNEQIIDACKYSEEFGMRVKLQNMIGLPVEDPLEDALQTLEFNQKVNVTNSWAGIYQPFKKTDLWQYCVDKNLIDKDTECSLFEENTILRIKDAEKINTLHKLWYIAVNYKIPIEVIKILVNQPLTDEVKKSLKEYNWKETAKKYYKI